MDEISLVNKIDPPKSPALVNGSPGYSFFQHQISVLIPKLEDSSHDLENFSRLNSNSGNDSNDQSAMSVEHIDKLNENDDSILPFSNENNVKDSNDLNINSQIGDSLKKKKRKDLQNLLTESERLVREVVIPLKPSYSNRRTVKDVIASLRDRKKLVKCTELKSSQELKGICPRLTYDDDVRQSPNADNDSLYLEEFANTNRSPIIEECSLKIVFSETRTRKKQNKKLTSLDILNEDLRRRELKKKLKLSIDNQSNNIRKDGASSMDMSVNGNLKEESRSDEFTNNNLLIESHSEPNDYEDDILMDDDEITSDSQSSADGYSSPHSDQYSSLEDDSVPFLSKRGNSTHIAISDDETDYKDTGSILYNLEQEENQLNERDRDVLVDFLTREWEKPALKPSRFVDAEAEEEDDQGTVVVPQDDDEEKALLNDKKQLFDATFGLIDTSEINSDENDTRNLFIKQMIEKDMEETEEIWDKLNQKKREREQEQEIRRILKNRRTYGRNNSSDKKANLPHISLSVDDNPINGEEAIFNEQLKFKIWKAQSGTDIIKSAESNNLSFSFKSSAIFSKSVDQQLLNQFNSNTEAKRSSLFRPMLINRATNAIDRLQEIQVIPERRSKTFTTQKMDVLYEK